LLRNRLGLLTVGLCRVFGVVVAVLLPLATKFLDFTSEAGPSLSYRGTETAKVALIGALKERSTRTISIVES
jgi:hypothetical protein